MPRESVHRTESLAADTSLKYKNSYHQKYWHNDTETPGSSGLIYYCVVWYGRIVPRGHKNVPTLLGFAATILLGDIVVHAHPIKIIQLC